MAQQGMWFNLPTSEEDKMLIQKKSLGLNSGPVDFTHANVDQGQKAILDNFKNEQMICKSAFELQNAVVLTADDAREGDPYENCEGCPSKFLLLCLNTIQNDLQHDEAMINERGRPFFALSWGFEFWKYFANGRDIMDASRVHSTIEQIAWIVSTASDAIQRREDSEEVSVSSPFLLYLVPSQLEAAKVCQVCRPLKAVGINTIRLHQGASIDHQIHSLRKCEPEFVISTPNRLTQLISLNAIDLSGVSMLVIDGPVYEGGSVDAIKTIRNSIPSSSQTLVFGGSLNH